MTIWNSTCSPCFSTFEQIVFVFHGLKTFFFYSLKLNFICYLNRFFTFDYSLWDGGGGGGGGDIRFYGSTLTKLLMHVSSRNMFPTTRNLQIRVHVFRPRHCCGD